MGAFEFWLKGVEMTLVARGVRRRTANLSNGRKISYLCYGPDNADTTLLLLHGLGSSSLVWVNTIRPMGRRMRVIAPDLPGYGFTPLPKGRDHLRFREYVDVVRELVESDVVGANVVFVGQSMGGWIGVRLARQIPSRIKQLILVNSAGLYYDGIERLRGLLELRDKLEVAAFWRLTYYRTPKVYRFFWRDAMTRMNDAAVSKFMASLDREDFINDDLPHLQMPVSLVWGRADRFLPIETVDTFIQGLQSTRVYWIPRCGHVPPVEAPRRFNRILRGMIETPAELGPVAPASAHASTGSLGARTLDHVGGR